jgi:hypothetical protein
MSTGPSDDRTERWRRFTILDLLLFQIGLGLGFFLVHAAGTLLTERLQDVPAWVARPGLLARSVTGITAGASIAGLLVLIVQWGLRGRRQALSAGEWIWGSPAVELLLFVVMGMGSAVAVPLMLLCVIFGIVLPALCLLLAVGIFVCEFGGESRDVPCPWADRAGATVGLLGHLALIGLAAGVLLRG